MVETLERPVARERKKAEPEAQADDGKTVVLAVASEIAGWVTDISRYATRKAKREGKPMGKFRVKNAVIVDQFLRRAVWELKVRCENRERKLPDTEKVPPPPPCTLAPLPVELP